MFLKQGVKSFIQQDKFFMTYFIYFPQLFLNSKQTRHLEAFGFYNFADGVEIHPWRKFSPHYDSYIKNMI